MASDYENNFQIIRGDSNGDGVVDECDYNNVKNYINNVNSSENFVLKNSDINGDGKIDEQDQDAILNYIRNKPVDPPIVPPIPNPITIVDPPFTQGRAIRKSLVFDNFDLKNQVESGEKVFANETFKVKAMSSDGKAYQIEYNSIYGGRKTRWLKAEDIEEYIPPIPPPTPDPIPESLQILIDYWTKKGKWKDHTYLSTVSQCKEFASYIFDQVYGVGHIGSGSTRDYGDNWRIHGLVKGVSQVGEVTETRNAAEAKEAFRNLFAQAKPGDFIQIKRGHDGVHSAIFVGWTEDGKIQWLDANADDNNGIKLQMYSLDELVETHYGKAGSATAKKYPNGFQWNVAMSIYRAK